jgi:two-component system phosphate regulon response regulator PhoB
VERGCNGGEIGHLRSLARVLVHPSAPTLGHKAPERHESVAAANYRLLPVARVLVIDDELDLREVLRYNLAQAGHDVSVAETGLRGLELARADLPDVLLLDLMLPDITGLEVCKALKRDQATQHIPIVMVTAKGEEIDRVVGFELGADDYIVKPFSIRELLLRVQAVLRRQAGERSPTPMLRFGALRIDRDAHRGWVNEEPLDLTALEFRLLVTLCDRRDRVQPRATLLRDVWQIDGDIPTRTVDTHVKRLREKLGACARCVETVRGVGYRFTATPDMSGSGAFEDVDEA